MRVPPLNLQATSNVAASGGATNGSASERLSLPPPLFSPDLLWRYQLSPFGPAAAAAAAAAAVQQQHQQTAVQPPSTPHSPAAALDLRSQLPHQLPTDPRTWVREEVVMFLHWCENEFDLPSINVDRLRMNGKALCMLNKSDLNERAPGAGDIVHNALQLLLVADSVTATGATSGGTPANRLPASPLTPQSLPACSVSPSWNHSTLSSATTVLGVGSASAQSDLHNHQQQQHAVSITLSPASSADSQCTSPAQCVNNAGASVPAGGGARSTVPSDMEDTTSSGGDETESPRRSPLLTPPPPIQSAPVPFPACRGSASTSPPYQRRKQSSPLSLTAAQPAFVKAELSNASGLAAPSSGSASQALSTTNGVSSSTAGSGRLSPACTPASVGGGNGGAGCADSGSGRLLWDFLQQLLNDPLQRFSGLIAWKNFDSGVFKIVDPQGLARLWGVQKNHLSMNYDKMSRALRYYYRVNILRKVQGERHCYQFLRSPMELKNLKHVSLRSGVTSLMASVKAEPRSPTQSVTQLHPHHSEIMLRSCRVMAERGGDRELDGEELEPSENGPIKKRRLQHQESPTDLSMPTSCQLSKEQKMQQDSRANPADSVEASGNSSEQIPWKPVDANRNRSYPDRSCDETATVHTSYRRCDDDEDDVEESEEREGSEGVTSARLCIDLSAASSSSRGQTGSPASVAVVNGH